MTAKFLVELPDGAYVSKVLSDLRPDDLVVFDSPESFNYIDEAQAKLDAEIAAAGGIEAWRDY
jgi:hypothetical protein